MKNLFFTFILLCGTAIVVFAQTEAVNGSSAQVKQVNKGVINGSAISLPKPVYPPAAKAVRAAGSVNVRVTIDENGDVIAAEVVSGHPLLQAASVQAARQAKFKPTLLGGQPVKVSGTIVYNFVAPEPVQKNEERLKILGLGMVLSMAQLDSFFEDEEFLNETPQEFVALEKELAPLKSIKSETKERRREILTEISSAVKGKLRGSELTKFEIGRMFGEVMAEAASAKEDKTYRANETLIKNNLTNLKSMLNSVEPDFPRDVLEKFILFANLSEKPELTSDDNLVLLVYRAMQIAETISPDSFK